jgi:hypothetical protein
MAVFWLVTRCRLLGEYGVSERHTASIFIAENCGSGGEPWCISLLWYMDELKLQNAYECVPSFRAVINSHWRG